MVSDRLISPWKLIHFGLVIASCDRSFRTSSIIWLPLWACLEVVAKNWERPLKYLVTVFEYTSDSIYSMTKRQLAHLKKARLVSVLNILRSKNFKTKHTIRSSSVSMTTRFGLTIRTVRTIRTIRMIRKRKERPGFGMRARMSQNRKQKMEDIPTLRGKSLGLKRKHPFQINQKK